MKILLLMDNPSIPTGYGTVCRMTATELTKRGHDVYSMGFNGGCSQNWNGFKIVQNTSKELYGDIESICAVRDQIKPDIYLFLNDTYRYSYLPELPRDIRERSIFWLPFEGETPDVAGLNVLKSVSAVRFLTKTAMDLHSELLTGSDIGHIPHAIDLDVFKPCSDKKLAKKIKNLENKFVVTRVDRHQPRKMFDLTLKAWAEFSENKDDVFFLAKCNPRDCASTIDLEKMALELGISEKIKFNDYFFNDLSLVREFYDPADVFISTTSGEGFGLGPVEALACGLPVICPNVPVLPEVVGNGGLFCSVSGIRSGPNNTQYNVVNTGDVVSRLEQCYQLFHEGVEQSQSARRIAELYYSTKSVYDQFEVLFSSVLNKLSMNAIKPSDRVMIDIVTRDRHSYLATLLTSLFAQDFQNWDVCIQCDDSDESIIQDHQIRSLLDLCHNSGHRFNLNKGSRSGPHVAHERTLRHGYQAGYELICRIDDDIIVKPDFLSKLFANFVSDTECKIAGVSGIYLNPRIPENEQLIKEKYTGSITELSMGPFVQKYPEGTKPIRVEHIYSSFMYRTRVGVEIGGYCLEYSPIGHREETDFTHRMHRAGYQLYIEPNAQGWHFASPSGGIRASDIESKTENALNDEKIFRARLEASFL